jgi:hypothetical protein
MRKTGFGGGGSKIYGGRGVKMSGTSKGRPSIIIPSMVKMVAKVWEYIKKKQTVCL